MNFLSVCSGIEAASVATQDLGWKAAAFSEIEPFPSAVLAHHWPDVPNLGDMTKYEQWPDTLRFDLLCGGTPCQAFSVAGLRKGLDDPRAQLSLNFVEIAAKYRPKWLVWENVPGVFSSEGGADFASLLAALTGREVCVTADGWGNSGHIEGIPEAYGIAWRVFDAQFAGVPQRRRRIFLVGYLGDWRRAAAVLFERHSMQGNPPPSREKREGTAEGSGSRSHWSGGPHPSLNQSHNNGGIGMSNQELFSQEGAGLVPDITGPITAGMSKGMRGTEGVDSNWMIPEVANCLQTTCDDYSSADGFNMIAHPTFCIAEKIIGRQDHNGGNGRGFQEGIAYTLNTIAAPAVAFAQNSRDELREMPIAGCLAAEPGMKQQSFVAYGVGEKPDTAHCLRSGASKADKHESTTYVKQHTQVRRLTPTECELLQGFPDGHTSIPWRNKPAGECPDGPRYKAIGNSWAVPCFRWIAQRINLINSFQD
jgi:DNA (cytosine-5)-methyltransferase 1